MSRCRVLLSAMAVAFSLSASQAGNAPAEPYCGSGYGDGVMAMLTPEQRMMHYADVQQAVAPLSFNDMRTYRSQLRNQFIAMTIDERRKVAEDLSQRWKALPPQQRAKLQQEFTTYRNDGRWGGPHGMRQGKSMGGCWW